MISVPQILRFLPKGFNPMLWAVVFLISVVIILTLALTWQVWRVNLCEAEKKVLESKLDTQNLGIDLLSEKNRTIEEIRKQLQEITRDRRRKFDEKGQVIKSTVVTGNECADLTAIVDSAREDETRL